MLIGSLVSFGVLVLAWIVLPIEGKKVKEMDPWSEKVGSTR